MGAGCCFPTRELFLEGDFGEGGGRNNDSLITGSFFTGYMLGSASMMAVDGEDVIFNGGIFLNSCWQPGLLILYVFLRSVAMGGIRCNGTFSTGPVVSESYSGIVVMKFDVRAARFSGSKKFARDLYGIWGLCRSC